MATIRKVVGQITLKRLVDVSSTTYFYLLLPSTAPVPATPTTSPPTVFTTTDYDGWQTTEPNYTTGSTRNLYVTIRTIYSDGSFEYTTPSLSSSYEAAKEAYNRAQSALTLAGDINNYFWWLTSSTDSDIPTGAYVTSIPKSTFETNKTGGNIVIQSTGLTIRNGIVQLASLTGQALNFYNPQATQGQNALQLSIGANGILQSGNYIRGNDSKFASSGTRVDLTTGEIYTPYFRLSQGLDGVNAGAYVHGTIEALDGRIGSGYIPQGETDETNYWEIGNYTDYDLHNTAKIIGHGSSFIQLGDDGTWRLATNRIHTGWHEEGDTLLHFPEYTDGTNVKYWDYGMHSPTSKNDKFIYIRNAPNNTALSNLLYDIDDNFTNHYWTYKFYIDGDGNLTTTGSINAHSISIDGQSIAGGSLVAGSLASYGGSSTQPVYFPSTGENQGKPTAIGYTIQTSVPSNAVFTDTKNTAGATDSNSKLFLIGATAQSAEPQTYSHDTVYVGTDGLLYSGGKKVAVIDDITAVLKYKGTKSTIANLPSTDNTTGDVWHVTANNGEYAWDGSAWQELGSTITIPANTGNSVTNISIADHSTTDIYGVSSSTTSVTGVSGSTSVYGVKSGTNSTTTASKASGSNGTAASWTFEEKTIPNVTAAGSGSLVFTIDGTDTKKLVITHTHTAPTFGTSIKVQSKSGGSNGTASSWSFSDVTVPIRADSATTVPTAASSATTVPIKNGTATTVVTSNTHNITDNGHTHAI